MTFHVYAEPTGVSKGAVYLSGPACYSCANTNHPRDNFGHFNANGRVAEHRLQGGLAGRATTRDRPYGVTNAAATGPGLAQIARNCQRQRGRAETP